MGKVGIGYWGRCCLFLLLFCMGIGISSVEASEDRPVKYDVTYVELDDDKIIFEGVFKNETDVFQRVKTLTLRYVLSDIDGYPLILGKFRVNDVDVTVGDTEIPYNVTTENLHAKEFSTDDVAHWKIETQISVDD